MKILVLIIVTVLACQANAFIVTNDARESLEEDFCQDCKDMMTKVKYYLLSPKEENATSNGGDNLLCSMFNSPKLSEGCKYLVNSAVTGVMQVIGSELDPEVICAQLDICSENLTTNTTLYFGSSLVEEEHRKRDTFNDTITEDGEERLTFA